MAMAPRSGEDSNPRPLANRSRWLLFGAVGVAVVTAAVLGLVFGLPQKVGCDRLAPLLQKIGR